LSCFSIFSCYIVSYVTIENRKTTSKESAK
jgi:hypothetical protein